MTNSTIFTGWTSRLLLGLLGLALLALVHPAESSAQEVQGASLDECAGGTVFLIAHPDTVTNTRDARFPDRTPESFVLLIYSPVNQQISIGRAGGAGKSVQLTANEVYEFDTKEVGVPLVTIWNQVERSKVIEVNAKVPIVIYGYVESQFGCHGFTVLPVETWGTEYYAAAWPGEAIRNVYPAGETNYDASERKEAPAEIMIIAAYDNTNVSINPTGGLYQCNQCTQVTLNRGEAYIVQSYVDLRDEAEDQEDIAGTLIQANKRIGVVSGNTRTQVDPFSFPMLAGNSPKDQTAEWLTPTEQHGTEFVFMPTEDDLKQAPNKDVTREAEFVRIYPTDIEETEMVWLNNQGKREPVGDGIADPMQFGQLRIGFLDNAIPFFTSDPSQGYQSPKSVAEFNGTTGSGNFIGASYKAWGTYMVEMVPREQWTSFAPWRAPSIPSDFSHYLNLVTDTNSLNKVYRKQGTSPRTLIVGWKPIAGTDLAWISLTIDAGSTYIFEGDSGAVFGGFGYGLRSGYELYRPGGAKKDDDDDKRSIVAGGGDAGDNLPSILHPSEYEEGLGMMYGMPLAPSRCVLLPPDEFEIITKPDCDELDIQIKTKNTNAAGIKFIRLVVDSTKNARLEPIDPDDFIALRERVVTEAHFRLVAINPLQDAEAVVEFKDRTRDGQIKRIRWKYQAERVDLDPADILDFGSLTINQPAGQKAVTITNPLNKNVVVKKLKLAFGNREFKIVGSEPSFTPPDSVVLKPGESMKVFIDITPKDENRVYEDSLVVELGCVTVRLPLRAATVQPCLFVSDLDFGVLGLNSDSTRSLEICNTGDGEVSFIDPYLTWGDPRFSVPQSDIDRLRDTKLGPGDCITISVTFSSGEETGKPRTVARFWATTRKCRDTSIWTAEVTQPGPQITDAKWREWLVKESGCTKNEVSKYCQTLEITNDGDSPFKIDDIKLKDDPDNVFTVTPVNSDDDSIGVAGRNVAPGDVILVRVCFYPKEEKVYYSDPAKARLYFTSNNGDKDSIDGNLEGEGIESYVSVTDLDFQPRIQFTTPGATTITDTVWITASGNRDSTHITDVFADDPNFTNLTFIDPPRTLPFWLKTGERQPVLVTFDPTSVDPVDKAGTINVVGDFAYDGCSETDSMGVLTGAVYTLGATITNYDFGSILTCFEGDGILTVTNTGLDPVKVTDIVGPTPNDQYFTIDPDFVLNAVGTILAPMGEPGDALSIPVHFAPTVAGSYSADVTVTIMDTSETTIIQQLVGNVVGQARTINITLGVDDIPPTFPGLTIEDVAVWLTGEDAPNDPAAATISNFQFTINYDPGMMRLTGDVRLGDLFPASDGWQLEVLDRASGYLNVRIYNDDPTKIISGEGEVLLMDFITFIGDDTESTIEPEGVILQVYGMNSMNNCVNVAYDPGSTGLDSVCGLDFRLIEASGIKYALSDASPSITSARTEIAFSIGIEGRTTIEVFDQQGNRVGLLVDQELQPGGYAVSWDVESVPSGKYFYRINSGPWTETKEVMVQK